MARSHSFANEPLHHNTSGVAHTVEPPLPFIKNKRAGPLNSQLKDPGIKDFGWNVPPSKIAAPLMRGTSNDDIYTLIRRFNKKIYHVRAIDLPSSSTLDLEISEDEEFSPDKLRATLERLYMTVIVGLATSAKHVARIRSWNEPRRTAGFCMAYYYAWSMNALLPLLLSSIIILVLYPDIRLHLFPPAPLSVISGTSGNIQIPKAGTVGSVDSLSGAPEAHKGEAVEQEARHFVASLSAIAVSTAAGKGPGEDGNDDTAGNIESESKRNERSAASIDDTAPSPTTLVTTATDSKDLAGGDHAAVDPAKKPVHDAIWNKARPFMRLLTTVADTWERLGNAISPTYPFPYWHRFRLVIPLVPIVVVTYVVPATFFLHATSFFAIFGQPLIDRCVCWLTHDVPDWREYFDLKRTTLKGVPTNAQLTLTLLRIAERNKSPLPPPPTAADGLTPPTAGGDDPPELRFDSSNYDVDVDSDSDGTPADYEHSIETYKSDGNDDTKAQKKKNPGRRIAGFVKGAVKLGVESALGVDHVKASLGSDSSKKRIGAVSDPPLSLMHEADLNDDVLNPKEAHEPETESKPLDDGEGPCVFTARYEGKKGHIVLVESAISPCLAFAYNKPVKSFYRRSTKKINPRDLYPVFTVGLSDIVGLRKIGGFGWKAKMVVGWALGKEVVDGLELTEREGTTWIMTAIRGRDELFNRLIAMGYQRWESL